MAIIGKRLALILHQPLIDGVAVHTQVTVEEVHLLVLEQVFPCLAVRHAADVVLSFLLRETYAAARSRIVRLGPFVQLAVALDTYGRRQYLRPQFLNLPECLLLFLDYVGVAASIIVQQILLTVNLPVFPDDVTFVSIAGLFVQIVEHGQVLIDRAGERHGLVLLVQSERLSLILHDDAFCRQLVVTQMGAGSPLQESMSHREAFILQLLLIVHNNMADDVGHNLHHQFRQLDGSIRPLPGRQLLIEGCHDNMVIERFHTCYP